LFFLALLLPSLPSSNLHAVFKATDLKESCFERDANVWL
jgi:hypothetical protein